MMTHCNERKFKISKRLFSRLQDICDQAQRGQNFLLRPDVEITQGGKEVQKIICSELVAWHEAIHNLKEILSRTSLS